MHGADEQLKPRELSADLKVPEGTLAQWRSRGIGPDYFRLENGRVRYRRSDVDAWLSRQKRTQAQSA